MGGGSNPASITGFGVADNPAPSKLAAGFGGDPVPSGFLEIDDSVVGRSGFPKSGNCPPSIEIRGFFAGSGRAEFLTGCDASDRVERPGRGEGPESTEGPDRWEGPGASA